MNTVIQITKGKTKKGKQRIKELEILFPTWDCVSWQILKVNNTVLFNNKAGPWYFVIPSICGMNEQYLSKHTRWIHSLDDENFIVDKT